MKQFSYFLKIPNTVEGRKFIRELKYYMNKDSYRIKLRGRNPHRHFYGLSRKKDVPIEKAEYFTVYLKAKLGSTPLALSIDTVGALKNRLFTKRSGKWVKR
jgi:hypothetical protein